MGSIASMGSFRQLIVSYVISFAISSYLVHLISVKREIWFLGSKQPLSEPSLPIPSLDAIISYREMDATSIINIHQRRWCAGVEDGSIMVQDYKRCTESSLTSEFRVQKAACIWNKRSLLVWQETKNHWGDQWVSFLCTIMLPLIYSMKRRWCSTTNIHCF